MIFTIYTRTDLAPTFFARLPRGARKLLALVDGRRNILEMSILLNCWPTRLTAGLEWLEARGILKLTYVGGV